MRVVRVATALFAGFAFIAPVAALNGGLGWAVDNTLATKIAKGRPGWYYRELTLFSATVFVPPYSIAARLGGRSSRPNAQEP
jgi:hypothetical protein